MKLMNMHYSDEIFSVIKIFLLLFSSLIIIVKNLIHEIILNGFDSMSIVSLH